MVDGVMSATVALAENTDVWNRRTVTRGPELDVAETVVLVQSGRSAAFAELYGAFHRAVHAVLLARVPAQDAADLVQDVFATAFERIGDVKEPAAFGGWLMAIARNRGMDHQRRRRPVANDVEQGADPPPRAEALEALAAINRLSEAYRETLIMRLVEGMTGPEIAARTGLSPESVRVNLHRGMKLLRAELSGGEAEQ